MAINNYKDLLVWQKAMELVTFIYEVTSNFPERENYGLSAQMRRCGVSIPSNIAEGYGRRKSKEYIRFLNISKGSLYELETQIMICNNIKLINNEIKEHALRLINEIAKMLYSLINKLEIKEYA